MPEALALELFSQIADALAHAHRNHIIHRDIKPANIMLGRVDGRPHAYLTDFGIAKVISGESITTLTATGEVIGSPAYMSPEQCQGYKLDARSDIYAMGCVMYECLTGKPPFAGSTPVEILYKHCHHDVADVSMTQQAQVISANTRQIVMKSLEKDADNRYQAAEALLQDLKQAAAGKELTFARGWRFKIAGQWRAPLLVALALIGVVAAGTVLLRCMSGDQMQLSNPLAPGYIRQLQVAREKLTAGRLDEAKFIVRQALLDAQKAKAPAADLAKLHIALAQVLLREQGTRAKKECFEEAKAGYELTPPQANVQDRYAAAATFSAACLNAERRDLALQFAVEANQLLPKAFPGDTERAWRSDYELAVAAITSSNGRPTDLGMKLGRQCIAELEHMIPASDPDKRQLKLATIHELKALVGNWDGELDMAIREQIAAINGYSETVGVDDDKTVKAAKLLVWLYSRDSRLSDEQKLALCEPLAQQHHFYNEFRGIAAGPDWASMDELIRQR